MTKPAGPVFGQQLAPRVIFTYTGEQRRKSVDRVVAELGDLIPTSVVVESGDLERVRHRSYGLIVVFGDMPTVDGDLHVLQLGGTYSGYLPFVWDNTKYNPQLVRKGKSYARQWIIPEGLTERTRLLVEQDLLALVPRGSTEPDGYDGSTATLRVTMGIAFPEEYVPQILIADEDEAPFALKYDRARGKGRWHWVLPRNANPVKWVRLVLGELHELDPKSFPLRSGWAEDRRYMTAAESAAADELETVATEMTEAITKLTEREAVANTALKHAREAAEVGRRRLVREQGDPLVDAVREALLELGFSVSGGDADAEKGDKLEDLQVRCDAGDEDVALVEVRAYAGGVQLRDLLRINRFASRYQKKHGSVPARLWYVANQFVGKVPAERGTPLDSNPNEVETFAESDGMVIGTPDLLELVLRVERGELDASAAREKLWSATGYFKLD
jgi:hypothetical protein